MEILHALPLHALSRYFVDFSGRYGTTIKSSFKKHQFSTGVKHLQIK